MKTVKAVEPYKYQEQRERDRSLDLLKAFAIYLVIWGHAIMHFRPNFEESVSFNVIYSFHMPLFMMLSGYFATSSMELRIKEFFAKKFRQLLLPCLTWGIVCWLVISSGLIDGRFELHVRDLFTGWLGLIENFWFLKSCFICYTVAWICSKTGKYKWLALGGAIICSSTVGRFNLSMMFPSFVFGMLLRENTNFAEKLYRYRYLVMALFLIMLVGSFCVSEKYYIMKLIMGLLGAYSSFAMFKSFSVILSTGNILSIIIRVGETTLGIYVLQAIILEYLMPMYLDLSFFKVTTIEMCLPILSLLLTLFLYWVCSLINRSRFLAFFAFGAKR